MKSFNETNTQKGEINNWAFHGDVLLFKEELPENFETIPVIEHGPYVFR